MPNVPRDPTRPILPFEQALPQLEADMTEYLVNSKGTHWLYDGLGGMTVRRRLLYTGAFGESVLTVSKEQNWHDDPQTEPLPVVYRMEAAGESLRWPSGVIRPENVTFTAGDVPVAPAAAILRAVVEEFKVALESARPLPPTNG